MDIAGEVVELLLTRDADRAWELAQKLDGLNDDRRATEAKALLGIEAQLALLLDAAGEFPAECIILDHAEWHRGVLGILASRVVERTGRPALILSHEDGQAHGSGRSIDGFHLLDALTAIHQGQTGGPEVFSRFGGHAHAVGFSLPVANLELLRARMREHTTSLLTGSILVPHLDCDVELRLDEITPTFFEWLERCAPFGVGNEEPVFVTQGAVLCATPRIIKEIHVGLQIELPRGSNSMPDVTISALGWSRPGRGTDWATRCAELGLGHGSRVDLAYRVRKSTFGQSASLELELCDLRLATSTAPGLESQPG